MSIWIHPHFVCTATLMLLSPSRNDSLRRPDPSMSRQWTDDECIGLWTSVLSVDQFAYGVLSTDSLHLGREYVPVRILWRVIYWSLLGLSLLYPRWCETSLIKYQYIVNTDHIGIDDVPSDGEDMCMLCYDAISVPCSLRTLAGC